MIRFLFSALLILTCVTHVAGHNHHTFTPNESKRSDTIDVKHYRVWLNWDGTELTGKCRINYAAKMGGLNSITLDLLKLTVDSVQLVSGGSLNYSYNDSLLTVQTNSLSKGDTLSIDVFYHGKPFHERWGGWHTSGNYAFNLGVGFESIPHNLGKVWHPCFDNFVERASYTVTLSCNSGLRGIGSGVLIEDTTVASIRSSTWKLTQEIPTYLYGIAYADYDVIQDTITGLGGKIPSSIYCRAVNKNSVKNAFRNLPDMYGIYENRFGLYRWDRVGYAITTIGAMEHVTNIAYPENALTAETTIAHELSHHWWGDLITCETDRDMWINEGMAVFSEYLFLEDKYSVKQMNEDKEDNLSSVLRFAHIDEGGYQPISGIPRVHTYGDHSYKKGSLVAHNLRKFLGDSLFFRTAKSFLDSFQFKAVNSYDFRDFFSAKSGVDLTHFFNEWVFNGGMPDFQLWSWESQANTGLYKNSVVIKQNKAGNPALFTKVPLKIRFYAANGNSWVEKVLVSKDSESFQFQSPQKAVSVELNPDYDLSYAVTKAYDTLTTDGAANKSNLFLSWSVSKVQDTTRIWGETHWAKPFISIENQVELGVRVNLGRYWNFSSQDNADSLQISFSSFINAEEGQTDTGLIKYSLDSLVLLHRATGGEWKMVETGVTIHGIPNGRRGGFTLNNGKLGEYVLAEKDPAINDTLLLVENTFNEESPVSVYPNPSGGKLVFFNHNQWNRGEFIILNLKGEEVLHESIPNMGKEFSCDISRQPSGVYFYVINSGTDRYYGRIVKK